MRNRNFFLGIVGLAALSMTACSTKDMLENYNPDNVGAYLTLQLVGSEGRSFTKTTPGGDGTEAGTDVQNKISSLKVLLCDESEHKVKASYDVSASQLDDIPGGVKTKQILTDIGTFDVYVIANPPAGFSVNNDDVLIDKTIDAVTEALMQTQYAADNKFIMFNECNGTDKIAGTPITITAANDFNSPATCDPIKLDRLAVQIRSNAAEIMDISGITSENNFVTAADLQGFKLLNGATKVNLQQKWS